MMKYIKFFLIVTFACMSQMGLAQDENKVNFEQYVRRILLCAPTKDAALSYINAEIQIPFVNDGSLYDDWSDESKADWSKERKTGWWKQIWDDANYDKYYVDERMAKKKSVDAKQAYMAALAASFDRDYKNAAKYFSLAGFNQDEINLSIVGCNYMLNKDKSAALAAMNINHPTVILSDIAEKYQMYDIYQEKLQEMLKGHEVELKRAIRSKDYSTLISFIPYDIPKIDSLFAVDEQRPKIMIQQIDVNGKYKDRDIYQIEDFTDRNIITLLNESNEFYKNVGPNYTPLRDERKYFLNKCFAKHGMAWALSNDKLQSDYEKGLFPLTYNERMLRIAVRKPFFEDFMKRIWNEETKNGHNGFDAQSNKLIQLILSSNSIDQKIGFTMTLLSWALGQSWFNPDLVDELKKILNAYDSFEDESLKQFFSNQVNKANKIAEETPKDGNIIDNLFKGLTEDL